MIRCPSEPSERMATLPSSASRMPTTSRCGTFARLMFADLVVDLFVAEVAFHADARGFELGRHLCAIASASDTIVATTACTGASQTGKRPA